MRWAKVHILFFIFLLFSHFIYAQQQAVTIEVGEKIIEPTERFTVKLTVRDKAYNVGDFPNIEGFTKAGKSVSHTTFREGGKKGIQHTITQNYLPTALGTFKYAAFTVKVNEQDIEIEGGSIRVVADKTKASQEPTEKPTNVKAKEDALLALMVSEKEVFVGQGIKVTVSFYVSSQNTVGWDFPNNLTNQVEAIATKLKPENCLESRFTITNVTSEKTQIGTKDYTRYVVFQAIYYPLDEKQVVFPAVNMSMWRVNAKNIREVEKSFSTKPETIKVKQLPEHPLKNKVAVGNFYLQEWLSKSKVQTGNSFTYRLKIIGDGNFTTVGLDAPVNDSHFDFYPAKTENKIKLGVEHGEREFEYPIFPKDSGVFELKNYFQWVFFNTKTATYDTLKPTTKVEVIGEKVSQAKATSADIYDGIEDLNTAIETIDYRLLMKNIANVLIVAMMIILLFLFTKK